MTWGTQAIKNGEMIRRNLRERENPRVALSVRQPWAWLIVNGYKDVENREWDGCPGPRRFRGPVWIHAGQTLTRPDYQACIIFITGQPELIEKRIPLPSFEELKAQCGGIVGRCVIVNCLMPDETSESPWWTGSWGLVLRNPVAVPFRPCKGALGFFKPNLTTTNNERIT